MPIQSCRCLDTESLYCGKRVAPLKDLDHGCNNPRLPCLSNARRGTARLIEQHEVEEAARLTTLRHSVDVGIANLVEANS